MSKTHSLFDVSHVQHSKNGVSPTREANFLNFGRPPKRNLVLIMVELEFVMHVPTVNQMVTGPGEITYLPRPSGDAARWRGLTPSKYYHHY